MGTFRDYENPARSTAKEFYRLNHRLVEEFYPAPLRW
jgi:hypothetical protein